MKEKTRKYIEGCAFAEYYYKELQELYPIAPEKELFDTLVESVATSAHRDSCHIRKGSPKQE